MGRTRPRAPRIADLRGRVSCSGSGLTIGQLLERASPTCASSADNYHDGLGVIGVHCPKYPAQRDANVVLRAVNRLGLRHAVANDSAFRVWQDYGDRGMAERGADRRGRAHSRPYSREKGVARKSIPASPHCSTRRPCATCACSNRPLRPCVPSRGSRFRFRPGCSPHESFLYVSDSGHHRILECRHDGRVLRVFGSGNAGFRRRHGNDRLFR